MQAGAERFRKCPAFAGSQHLLITGPNRYNAAMPRPRNIVIFLPNWVGDVVMATPALRALRRHFKDARIHHAGKPIALETLGGTDLADGGIADRWSQRARPAGLLEMLERLRAGRFDLAILLPNSFRSAMTARLAGIGCVAGYRRDGRGWLLTEKIPPPRDERGRLRAVSAIDYYLALAAMLGARCDSRRMELAVTGPEEAEAEEILRRAGVDGRRPCVMLNPGASFGPSKMWPPRRFAAVADALIERHGAQIIVNAAPSERSIAAEVGEAMRHRPAVNFADRDNTIGLLKSLVRRCTLLITNDTGARHIAAALGIGVVSLFGSTDPRWAQIDCPLERIVRVDVPCSPCRQKICPQRPGPAYHRCMAAITPEMVLDAAEEVLGMVRAAREARP